MISFTYNRSYIYKYVRRIIRLLISSRIISSRKSSSLWYHLPIHKPEYQLFHESSEEMPIFASSYISLDRGLNCKLPYRPGLITQPERNFDLLYVYLRPLIEVYRLRNYHKIMQREWPVDSRTAFLCLRTKLLPTRILKKLILNCYRKAKGLIWMFINIEISFQKILRLLAVFNDTEIDMPSRKCGYVWWDYFILENAAQTRIQILDFYNRKRKSFH